MQEQLITFETAVLAKEIGFYQGEFKGQYPSYSDDSKIHSVAYFDSDRISYYATTQSLLQKWLRDIHSIHVEPVFNYDNDKYSVRVHNSGKSFISAIMNEFGNESAVFIYDTYEQALEAGLQEALR